ncbi:MAG: dephospho-CoA kinase [Pseudomonadota bacterium]|nr:dephospho-CoA kinase [Pseudomonadota bacterium]
MTLVVGLTGGIGSGKSAVGEAFAKLGVDVTDTDVVSHRLTARGQPGYDAIVRAFGEGMLDASGSVDRSALRRAVFSDVSLRRKLEALLHPLIRAATLKAIGEWSSPYGLVVVPLLLERGGLTSVVDRILVVDCTEEQQIERVRARSGLAESEVRAIMAAQLGRSERLAAADDIVDNSGGPGAIKAAVAALDGRYRELAGTTPKAAR